MAKTATNSAFKLLVVDDEDDVEEIIRQKFRRRIRKEELSFVFAKNGAEALSRIEEIEQFDLIITDIRMPVMDGLTLLGEVQIKHPGLRAIVITAYGDMGNIREAMHTCAFDFLTKPVNLDDLERTIDRTLSFSVQQREIDVLRDQKLAAEAASTAKSIWLASISHELRTPLNAIIGMGELLQGADLPDDQRRYVDVLTTAGDTLLSLINDILDLSKIEAGRLELDQRVFDLRKMIAGTTQLMRVPAEGKGLQLIEAFSDDVAEVVFGDDNRLRQVLLNLLSNAVKFTAAGQVTLKVAATSEPDLLQFQVIDTGIGIDEDKQETVFEEFVQADAGTSREYGGTGLGLSICRKLVGLMGGEMGVRSVPGKGSTFYFTAKLPARSHDELADDPAGAPVMGQPGRPLKVLLVEDVEYNRFLITSYINGSAHRLTWAENGRQGLERFQADAFDLVLMDIEMPIMNGIDATAAIRAWERDNQKSPTPIVALSAYSFNAEIQKAFDAGCGASLTKPIRERDLYALLAQYGGSTIVDPAVRAAATAATAAKATASPASAAAGIDPSTSIKVVADQQFAEIIPRYLNHVRDQVPRMRADLDTGALDTVRLTAHRLRGTGASYGFEPISEHAGTIEDQVQGGDLDRVRQALDELERFLQRVEVTYR